MKHGVRFWEKKVGLSRDLTIRQRANLMTQLITFERLNLTKAKAEWVKYYTDRLIDVAKAPQTTKTIGYLAENLEHSHLTLRKLCGPLVARYANRKDEYTRIIRYGSRGQGTNQAELAYVELMDHKYDSSYALALYRADKIRNKIKEYEDAYFEKKEFTVQDPLSARETPAMSYTFKPGLSSKDCGIVRRHLQALFKKLQSDKVAVESYKAAREAERRHIEITRENFEKTYKDDHKRLQALVDKNLEPSGEIPKELLDKLPMHRARLENNRIVPYKTPQDIAFETGELPVLYTVDRTNSILRLNPERRLLYYLDRKKIRGKVGQKFSRTYIEKKERFPLPSNSKDIPDKSSMGPPAKKKLTKKEFIDKYIDLATPKLIKSHMKKINAKNNPINTESSSQANTITTDNG